MSKKFKLLSLFITFTLCSNLYAQELSLKELIDIALKNNTNIEINKNQKTIKEQELKNAKSTYLPQISLNANTGSYDIKSNGINQDGKANSLTLNANQLIYDFGKTTSQIKASKYNLEASKNDISSSIQNTILQVKEAYFDILNKYEQIAVAIESIKLDELQLSQAKEYFKAGVRTQIDVTNAQLKLSNSKLTLLQDQYNLKTSKAKLISILGTTFDTNFELKRDKKSILELSKNETLKFVNLDSLIKMGLKNREELKKYNSLIKSNKEDIKNVQAQYYPRIDLSASYTDQNSNDIASLDTEQSTIILGLKWNLFTGDSTRAQKQIAITKLKNTNKQFEQEKLEITQEITTAHLNLRQSYESIDISLLNLELATKNLDLATQRYQAGLNDLLELNDAKLEYTQSKTNLVNTYYSYLTNFARLEYALGVKY